MKFNVDKNHLLHGVQTVQNIITPKATLPILSNILIEAGAQKAKLIATDLDIGITCAIPVKTEEPGIITIPAKRFSEIIKELPGENITIYTKKNNLVIIETESCQFKIVGLSHEEFPKLPEFKDKEVIKIEQAALKQMLRLTSFAVSFDEARYILNGALCKMQNNKITLVTTDGKRLAIMENPLQQGMEKESRFIIPIKTIHELNRNLQEEGDLTIILSNNQALFDLGATTIVSRLIEGEFPDYQQVIPLPSENKISIDREQFLLAIRRAALLATPDYQAVKLEVFKNRLVVSKSTPDVGESREEVMVEYKGKEMIIGFNPAYLIDVLKNLSAERIEFELTDSEKPGVIRINQYTYIVLPMRLN